MVWSVAPAARDAVKTGLPMTILKRNASAFSLNAIVDVLRRHEMIFFNVSETFKASNF